MQLEKRSYPTNQLIANLDKASVMSKMVKNNKPRRQVLSEGTQLPNLDEGRMQSISKRTREKSKQAYTVLQLFPDVGLAGQILVTSILSPKDALSAKFIYKLTETFLPSNVSMSLINTVKDHVSTHYKLEANAFKYLREALLENGSHIRLIIPESSIDDIINSNQRIATEDLEGSLFNGNQVQSFGILGNPDTDNKKRYGLESFQSKTTEPYKPFLLQDKLKPSEHTIELTDNLFILKLPYLQQQQAKLKAREIYGKKRNVGLESSGHFNRLQEFYSKVYKTSKSTQIPMVQVKPIQSVFRRSVGRPLDTSVPPEACIPFHAPGEPDNHIGYILLIDESGYFLSSNSIENQPTSLKSIIDNQTSSITTTLLDRAKSSLQQQECDDLSLDDAATIYGELVEKEIAERISNGLLGVNGKLANKHEFYRIMLARQLSNQYTRLLYVPAEMITYIALKYHDNGVGKTLLDDLMVLMSMRAIVMMAKIMGVMKNNIDVTTVKMRFSPEDPDPMGAFSIAEDAVLKLRQNSFPLGLGINGITDLTEWTQRAGLRFTFENHPELPDTGFEFQNEQMTHNIPDDSIDEELRKLLIMGMGVNPEAVDNSLGSDYATTDMLKNILFVKRTVDYGEAFMLHISRYVRIIMRNDMDLQEKLIDTIKNNIGSFIEGLNDEDKVLYNQDQDGFVLALLDRFIDSHVLEIPKPDTSALEDQAKAFETVSDAIDKVMETCYFNDDLLKSELAGNINSHVNSLKAAYKSYFLRNWMAENNYLSPLADMVNNDDDGNPIVNIQTHMKDFIEGLVRGSIHYIQDLQKVKDAADTDLDKIVGEASPDSSSEDTGGSDDSYDEGNDDGFEGDGGPTEEEPSEEKGEEEAEPDKEEPQVDDGEKDE